MSWAWQGGRSLRGVEAETSFSGLFVGCVTVATLMVLACCLSAAVRKRVQRYGTLVMPMSPKVGTKSSSAFRVEEEKGDFSLQAHSGEGIRAWFNARVGSAGIATNPWFRDVEKFVGEFEDMELRCVKTEQHNAELQNRVECLEQTLRKFPQTPMTCVSLGTTRDTSTPPTSDATDAMTPRESEMQRLAAQDEITETSDDGSGGVASLSFLPAPKMEAADEAKSSPVKFAFPEEWVADSPRDRGFRPTEKQRAAEELKTFTPLFDEKGLSTPRTLMELVSAHRLTKESLQARITRRKQQDAMQKDQFASCEKVLPQEKERADVAVAALEKLANASPRSRAGAVQELLEFHGKRIPTLAKTVSDQRDQAETWLAYAYRIQSRLDREMDIGRLETLKHPAGVLMKSSGGNPPIALGSLTLPLQKELSTYAVDPYKVDSWPIEPNSRGGRASGDLAIPPLRESDEEDLPPSENDSEEEEEEESGDAWSPRGGEWPPAMGFVGQARQAAARTEADATPSSDAPVELPVALPEPGSPAAPAETPAAHEPRLPGPPGEATRQASPEPRREAASPSPETAVRQSAVVKLPPLT